MSNLALKIDGSFAPRHLQLDGHDEFPMQVIMDGFFFGYSLSMWKSLTHCHEPSAFLALKRLFVDYLHHVSCVARAVCKDQVCLMPLYFKHITYDGIKTRCRGCWPAKNCFILCTLHSLNVVVVDGLESQRNVLEGF